MSSLTNLAPGTMVHTYVGSDPVFHGIIAFQETAEIDAVDAVNSFGLDCLTGFECSVNSVAFLCQASQILLTTLP